MNGITKVGDVKNTNTENLTSGLSLRALMRQTVFDLRDN